MLAALAEGRSVLENALFSEDTHWFSECLQKLDIPVVSQPEAARFEDRRRDSSPQGRFVGYRYRPLDLSRRWWRWGMAPTGCGRRPPHAGASHRHVDRVASWRDRVEFEGHCGRLYMPYVLHRWGFKGAGSIALKADQTSQQLSALLMIAPYAQADTTMVLESWCRAPTLILPAG
ncbi:MAG: hypothetical protein U0401_20695 [Anaerolineae bacterium]